MDYSGFWSLWHRPGGFEVIVATTRRVNGPVVIRVRVLVPVDDILDCGGHPVIAATARRRSGTEANLPIVGQEGAKSVQV